VREFYKTDRIYHVAMVPGAQEGIQTLKKMGFRLVIVTARQEDAGKSWKWVSEHFPGLPTKSLGMASHLIGFQACLTASYSLVSSRM